MFKISIELNKSNSWMLITTFYVLITVHSAGGGALDRNGKGKTQRCGG